MSSMLFSDHSAFASVILGWDTVRGTLCDAHWYITLILNLRVHQAILLSQIILSSTQTSKIDEPPRINAALRHFEGICKKIRLRILEFLFSLLCAQVLAKYQSSWKQQDNWDIQRKGKEPSNCPLKDRLFFSEVLVSPARFHFYYIFKSIYSDSLITLLSMQEQYILKAL